MNAERLLAHFERISEAPDAIARLRRFILDLAVRGKLVEQDPEDEPAAELLRLISMEKGLHLKNSRIARGFQVEVSTSLESPFDLPASWEWIPATYPASSISDADKKVQTKDVLEAGAYPVVDQGKVFIRGYCNDPTKVIKVEEPLILFGDHTRETKFIDFDFVVGADGVKLLKPIGILPDFYFLTLRWLPLDSRGYGRHFKLLKSSVIPLPPLAEQHRIVAKVDELMALCDQLEAARQQRQQGRERLVAATLQRLNQPTEDPASFRNDASFALQVLPSLTTTPAQIKQLRQTILNLAVRGKLVGQDPEDEPATNWASRFVKDETLIGVDDSPYQVPDSWLWFAVAEIFDVGGGIQKTPQRAPRQNSYPYLGVANVYRGRLDLSVVKEFELEPGEIERRRLRPADLLIIEGNGSLTEIGRCAKWNGEIKDCVHQNHVIRCRPCDTAISDFLLLFLNSPSGMAIMQRLAITSSGLYSLSVGKIRKIEIPLPPLAEQHRIVAKVDELMALCDQLEQQLSQADQQRRRLLEALLAEALGGRLPTEQEESHAAIA